MEETRKGNKPRNQFLYKDQASGVEVWIKRLDESNAESWGNKAYKLKYNIIQARSLGFKGLLTFGGAFSNHIAAVASLGKKENLPTVGIIRGEELNQNLGKTLEGNPSLRNAVRNGMHLEFVSRELYRQKTDPDYLKTLKAKYPSFYFLPEGGTNALAVKGCETILADGDRGFDVLSCSVGTGGTIAGIIRSSREYQSVLGFAALKADLSEAIENYTEKNNWKLIPDDEFGGFGKINKALVEFINNFKEEYGVPLDPVYNGKMMYGLKGMVNRGNFKKNTRILAIHTGGLQGILGMNKHLERKNWPVIQ